MDRLEDMDTWLRWGRGRGWKREMLGSLYAEACLRMQEADGSAVGLRNLTACEKVAR